MPSHCERGRSEAPRKAADVEFERRLERVRDDANPDTRRARLAADIIEASPFNATGQIALAYLPAADREAVRALVLRIRITPLWMRTGMKSPGCSMRSSKSYPARPSTRKYGKDAGTASYRWSASM
jgi:hypothetical protein